MAYCLAVRWTIKDGELETVLTALRRLVEASRQEPGCLMYQAHRDPGNPNVVFLYEQYDDEAAYAAHGASDHFKQYALEQAIPVLANRERAFYETIGG